MRHHSPIDSFSLDGNCYLPAYVGKHILFEVAFRLRVYINSCVIPGNSLKRGSHRGWPFSKGVEIAERGLE